MASPDNDIVVDAEPEFKDSSIDEDSKPYPRHGAIQKVLRENKTRLSVSEEKKQQNSFSDEDEFQKYVYLMPSRFKENNFDILLLSNESDIKEVRRFKRRIERDCLVTVAGIRRKPVVKLEHECSGDVGPTRSLDLAFSKALFIFLFVTKAFCEQEDDLFKGHSCLMRALEEKKWCVVPIISEILETRKSKKYSLPMMLRSLRAINYYDKNYYKEAVAKLLESNVSRRAEMDLSLDEERKTYFLKHRKDLVKKHQKLSGETSHTGSAYTAPPKGLKFPTQEQSLHCKEHKKEIVKSHSENELVFKQPLSSLNDPKITPNFVKSVTVSHGNSSSISSESLDVRHGWASTDPHGRIATGHTASDQAQSVSQSENPALSSSTNTFSQARQDSIVVDGVDQSLPANYSQSNALNPQNVSRALPNVLEGASPPLPNVLEGASPPLPNVLEGASPPLPTPQRDVHSRGMPPHHGDVPLPDSWSHPPHDTSWVPLTSQPSSQAYDEENKSVSSSFNSTLVHAPASLESPESSQYAPVGKMSEAGVHMAETHMGHFSEKESKTVTHASEPNSDSGRGTSCVSPNPVCTGEPTNTGSSTAGIQCSVASGTVPETPETRSSSTTESTSSGQGCKEDQGSAHHHHHHYHKHITIQTVKYMAVGHSAQVNATETVSPDDVLEVNQYSEEEEEDEEEGENSMDKGKDQTSDKSHSEETSPKTVQMSDLRQNDIGSETRLGEEDTFVKEAATDDTTFVREPATDDTTFVKELMRDNIVMKKTVSEDTFVEESATDDACVKETVTQSTDMKASQAGPPQMGFPECTDPISIGSSSTYELHY